MPAPSYAVSYMSTLKSDLWDLKVQNLLLSEQLYWQHSLLLHWVTYAVGWPMLLLPLHPESFWNWLHQWISAALKALEAEGLPVILGCPGAAWNSHSFTPGHDCKEIKEKIMAVVRHNCILSFSLNAY